MASLEDLLEDEEWRRNWTYATTQQPNQGYFKRWPQGSIGMNSPMNIWSTEASTLTLKHGIRDPAPYRAFIKPGPFVTPQMQNQVEECVKQTWSGEGCIGKALYKVAREEDAVSQQYSNRYRAPPYGPQD